MMIVNRSDGVLHLDSLGIDILKGQRFDVSGSTTMEVLAQCPELVILLERDRVALIEDEATLLE